jgi:Cu(I)/Ag(I) efflux system membrane fusion protein
MRILFHAAVMALGCGQQNATKADFEMKNKSKLVWSLIGLVTVGLGGLAAKVLMSGPSLVSERKIAFYQDSMHPWIKAGQPGKCTICEMDLTPIYEGAAGFAVSGNLLAMSSNQVTVLNVQTETVRRKPLHRTVRVAGVLEANQTSKRVISASRDGRVERLAVPYAGFEVTKGMPLANYFIPELLAEARRYAFLAQTGSQTPRPTGMELSNPLLSAQQNLRLFGFTEAQIAELARTGKAEGSFDLLSPIAGTVIERNVSEGQYVSQGTRLFTIVDLSVLWFLFDVYEQDLYWLQCGQEVSFRVPSAPGRVFSGPIKFMEPFVNDTTRSAKVRVDVDNPVATPGSDNQRALRPQQYAEGWAQVVKSNLLVVPSTAILYPGHQAYAYVDQGNGAYQMRPVTLGRRGDQHWEVLSGLEEGEDVVIAGNVLMDAQAQFKKSGERDNPSSHAHVPEVNQIAAAGDSPATDDHRFALTQPQQAALSNLLAETLTCGEEVKRTAALPKAPPLVQDRSVTVADVPPTQVVAVTQPPAAPLGQFSRMTAGASAEVQPLNSRNHSLFEHRMNDALSARFGRGRAGASRVPDPVSTVPVSETQPRHAPQPTNPPQS